MITNNLALKLLLKLFKFAIIPINYLKFPVPVP